MKLNDIESTIKLTFKDETNTTLHFLDILLIQENYKLKFKAYRKTTNKNNLINFYSQK